MVCDASSTSKSQQNGPFHHNVCQGIFPAADVRVSRGDPTELCDRNYHRNKTIQFWSNGITSLYRKYMVFPLKYNSSTENVLLDYKIQSDEPFKCIDIFNRKASVALWVHNFTVIGCGTMGYWGLFGGCSNDVSIGQH